MNELKNKTHNSYFFNGKLIIDHDQENMIYTIIKYIFVK